MQTGRFSGSNSWFPQSNSRLDKISSVNDGAHHFAFAVRTATALSGSGNGFYITLCDGATAQCSIVIRQDGAILLTSGGPLGGTLATYASALTAISTWYHFECEVVVHGTTGSFKVRKNGNSVEDFSLGSLNTRVSANDYANKIQIGNATAIGHWVDDFFWKSSAAAGTWLGDIRCYTRMPASDQSVTFSHLSGSTNYEMVDEAQQDGTTTYVYDSTVGHADFYGIASISATPATVIATTARAYALKSDAGTRTLAVQVKSGATTAASPTLVLTTSGWQWAWRTDTTDPATGAAWTPAAVNTCQIGPKVIA
jgi:hypothetical protein